MAKDDYFVIVYRILAYLYQCFKAGEAPDKEMFGPEALGINNGYWANVIESIVNEGYITGVSTIPSLGGIIGIRTDNIKITQKGIEFLQENSQMAKVREFLRTAKDIIPGI